MTGVASKYGFSRESQVWTLASDELNNQVATNIKVIGASNAVFPVLRRNENRGDVAVLVVSS